MNDDSQSGALPVKVDISAKAEIKAEVPEASAGRTLDALTDIIRPFTEALGLRADRIRLQREDVLIEIAKKARARLEVEGAEIRPVPLRVMVPLLERASLADPGDETLSNAWASLLQSASQHDNANYGLFIDVLSKLDPAHLKFLDFLMLREAGGGADDFMNIDRRRVENFIAATISELVDDPTLRKNYQLLVGEFDERVRELFHVNGCVVLAGAVDCRDEDGKEPYFELNSDVDLGTYPETLIDALVGVNVVERVHVHFESPRFSIWLGYVSITDFGYGFYECSHPSGQRSGGVEKILSPPKNTR